MSNNTDKPVVPEWFAEWYEREFGGLPKNYKAVEAARMLLQSRLGVYELYPLLLAVVNDEYKVESRYKVQLYSNEMFNTYWFANNGEELTVYELDWLRKEKEIYFNDSRLLSKAQMETLKQKWPKKIEATEVKDWGFTER